MREKVSIAICLVVLVASITRGFWLLVAFFVGLSALALFLRWRPDSRLAMILTTWIGPYPQLGELQFRYLLRVGRFALGVFIVLGGGIVWATYAFPYQFKDPHPVLAGLVFFALPLLAGMAALGGIGCVIKAIWLRLTGRDGYFVEQADDGVGLRIVVDGTGPKRERERRLEN